MGNRKPKGYWTLERCIEDAAPYRSRMEWKAANSSAYSTAARAGWLDQCCGHMKAESKPRGYWTLERCMESAARHSSKKEWERAEISAYSIAHRNGWIEQCCKHMVRPDSYAKLWTFERCMEDAAKHNFRSEWRGSAYNAALREGWIDQCTAHMASHEKATDNDVVYIWHDAGTDLHKVGVTSARIGEQRIGICSSHNDMDPRIVFMLRVPDARAVESKLLELGNDPELDSSIDGYTEFRRLSDAELGKAVSIAYEAALAA